MGEYADEIVDRMIGDYGWGSTRRPRTVAKPTCSICGKRNLRWGQKKDGWQLVDPHTSIQHVCLLPDEEGRLPRPRII